MFPFACAGDEEHFDSLHKEIHKDVWGSSITPSTVYAQHSDQWENFAATFTHQAFLLDQLKSIYDNLAVVLRVFWEMQKESEQQNMFIGGRDCPPPIRSHESELNHTWLDPFEYFKRDHIDYAHRKIFLELFVNLATDMKTSKKGTMWREIGRSILENSYQAERASLVEELTSATSTDALNSVSGSRTADATIWQVRRRIVVRENAMQKALARLEALLEDDNKKAKKRSVEFERPFRRRFHIEDEVMPIREKPRSFSPFRSDEESVEIIEDHVEEA
jgi:hypothetical protein